MQMYANFLFPDTILIFDFLSTENQFDFSLTENRIPVNVK